MSPRPTVSVIMPAYQVARYVAQAIESVLAQRGVAFELLVGDDGSTDGTWGILHRYQGDPRVRAWRWRHRGAGATRNRLIAKARGRYLSICDADDLLLPGNLAILSRVLERDRGAGVACARRVMIDARGRRLGTSVTFAAPSARWDLVKGIIGYRGGTLLRRTLVAQVGGYREDLPVAEDYDLLLKLAERTRFVALQEYTLYGWRRHPGSLTISTPRALDHACVTAARRAAIHRRYGHRVSW